MTSASLNVLSKVGIEDCSADFEPAALVHRAAATAMAEDGSDRSAEISKSLIVDVALPAHDGT